MTNVICALDITALLVLRFLVLVALLLCQAAGSAHGASICLEVDDRLHDELVGV